MPQEAIGIPWPASPVYILVVWNTALASSGQVFLFWNTEKVQGYPGAASQARGTRFQKYKLVSASSSSLGLCRKFVYNIQEQK